MKVRKTIVLTEDFYIRDEEGNGYFFEPGDSLTVEYDDLVQNDEFQEPEEIVLEPEVISFESEPVAVEEPIVAEEPVEMPAVDIPVEDAGISDMLEPEMVNEPIAQEPVEEVPVMMDEPMDASIAENPLDDEDKEVFIEDPLLATV